MLPPTIHLVDDDAAVTRAIASVGTLMQIPVTAYSSAESFLKIDLTQRVGCLILDIRLPGMSGLELQAALSERKCELPIIVISGHADVPLAVEAMRRGALTVLQKPLSLDELMRHIRQAIELDQKRRDQHQHRNTARERLAALTAREREVLDLISQGLTNKESAAQLHLTLRAIEDRRARLMRRLAVRSVAELLLLVQQASESRSDSAT